MSEAIQARRRRIRLRRWLATLVVAGVLAALVAILLLVAFGLIDLVVGDTAWQRGWVDQKLAASVQWLSSLPIIGPIISPLIFFIEWDGLNGHLRDLMAVSLAAYPVMVIPARHVGTALTAQYDEEALRQWPADNLGLRWAGPLGRAQNDAWQSLQHWCCSRLGSGARPLFRPWAMPDVDERFSVAILIGENGVGKSHLAEALGKELDETSARHAPQNYYARLHKALTIRLGTLWWWRRRAVRPWDTGYLVEDPAARGRLTSFLPRRPTLIVADELPWDSLRAVIEQLASRRADFHHPVRLLVVDAVLPSSLGLRWDTQRNYWATETQELGQIPVITVSDPDFGPPQFRAMVHAQYDSSGQRLQLMGRDNAWRPLTDALDGQPTLLAEAIRLTLEGGLSLDALARDVTANKHMVDQQDKRVPTELPPDAYGKRRELHRESILRQRVQHREDVIRSILTGTGSEFEDIYYALLVATLAGGASLVTIKRMLGLKLSNLNVHLLALIQADSTQSQWLAPLKPAVIADQMLQRFFDAPRNTGLSEDARHSLVRAMRIAWLCNPGGALKTLARLRKESWGDEFSDVLMGALRLPELKGTNEWSTLRSQETRSEIARGFFELAIFHGGSVQDAYDAMSDLRDQELCRFATLTEALLTRPDVRGLPALILWLRLTKLQWTGFDLSDSESAKSLGTDLLVQAESLARKARTNSVCEEPLIAGLYDALNAILPHVSELAATCSGDARFQLAARELNESVRRDSGILGRLRINIMDALWRNLVSRGRGLSGQPNEWIESVMVCLAGSEVTRRPIEGVRSWLQIEAGKSLDKHESYLWAQARMLALSCFVSADNDAFAVNMAASQAKTLGELLPDHLGVQENVAAAWALAAWANMPTDPPLTLRAAKMAASVSAKFPRSQKIQYESLVAWRCVCRAYAKVDPRVSQVAAEAISHIAADFPSSLHIQYYCASSWTDVAVANFAIDAAAAIDAARRVALIAEKFPTDVDMQSEHIVAWSQLIDANAGTKSAAAAEANRRVEEVATAFPFAAAIQLTHAESWTARANSYSHIDALLTEEAAHRVASIARHFAKEVLFQHQSAMASRAVAWSLMKLGGALPSEAVARVSGIAKRFPAHPGIQHEYAVVLGIMGRMRPATELALVVKAYDQIRAIALRHPNHPDIQYVALTACADLVHAQGSTDPATAALTAAQCMEVLKTYPQHEGMHWVAAEVCRTITWAYMNIDPRKTYDAAVQVQTICVRFKHHAGIQHEGAMAWRNVVWAYRDIDQETALGAVKMVADIAKDAGTSEKIQIECATAWRIALEAAMRAGNEGLIRSSLEALDLLAGFVRTRQEIFSLDSQLKFPAVMKEVAAAWAAYDAWQITQDP